MSERLGTVALGHKEELVFLGREIGEQKNYSEKTAEAIDEEIRRLIDEGYAQAVEIITEHRDVLDRFAKALIQFETLDGDNLERVFRGEPPIEGGTPAERPQPHAVRRAAASASAQPCSPSRACRPAPPAPRPEPTLTDRARLLGGVPARTTPGRGILSGLIGCGRSSRSCRRSGTWDRLDVWEPAPADEATLELVHTPAHVASMRELTARGGGRIDADTVASAGSWEAALRAAGGAGRSRRARQRRLARQRVLPGPPARPPRHARPGDGLLPVQQRGHRRGLAARAPAAPEGSPSSTTTCTTATARRTRSTAATTCCTSRLTSSRSTRAPATGAKRAAAPARATRSTSPSRPAPATTSTPLRCEQIVEPAVRRYAPDFILVSLGFDAFWADPLASLRLSHRRRVHAAAALGARPGGRAVRLAAGRGPRRRLRPGRSGPRR